MFSVARIIDYDEVARTLTAAGLVCQYYRSGAFGFGDGRPVMIRGWIGPEDATIRPAMLAMTTSIDRPYEENLAALLVRAWRESSSTLLSGSAVPLWVMPGSHWAFELDANRGWLVELLAEARIDAALLEGRADGSAIEFTETESLAAERFVCGLLRNLKSSDFFLAFGGHAVVCMAHHHKQLWWSTTERPVMESLDRLVSR
jgi:hypothetical protein